MKNFLTMILLAYSCQINSQCSIIGNEKIVNAKEINYETTLEAQCSDCYQWKIEGEASFVMQSKTKRISVVGLSPGQFKLSVSALTNKGLESCEREITITENNIMNSNPNDGKISTTTILSSNCNFPKIDFKEVHFADNQAILYPADNPTDIKYSWEIKSKDGTVSKIIDKAPKINLDNNNPIVEIVMIMETNFCMKKYTKKYPDGFWESFK
ncbi:MAG: hypothetical protein JST62_08180 [Bacteroidetes bacterium]|nr:hypothetical protein [Bacteroidota bacterium]